MRLEILTACRVGRSDADIDGFVEVAEAAAGFMVVSRPSPGTCLQTRGRCEKMGAER
jgi:hypothetical protein